MSPIDTYINTFSKEVQERLVRIRSTILKAFPDAEEQMSYGVPAFKQNDKTVLYAAFKNHIGLYPTPKVIEIFKEELIPYKTSKGAIQFPHDKELPMELILKIARYRFEH